MYVAVVGLQQKRAPKRLDRLLDASQIVQRRAAAFLGFGQLRISRQRVGKFPRRLLEPLRAQICRSPIVICVRIPRGDRGRLAKAGDGLLVPRKIDQGVAKIGQDSRFPGARGQRGPVEFHGLQRAALCPRHQAEIAQHCGRSGLEFKSPAQVLACFLVPALPVQGQTQVVERLPIIRPQQQGLAKRRRGSLQVSQVHSCKAELVVGFGVVAVECGRALQRRASIARALELQERLAQIELIGRVLRIDGDCLAEPFRCRCRVASLCAKNAKQVHGVGIARKALQHLQVHRFGFRQKPFLMQAPRLLQGSLCIDLGRFRWQARCRGNRAVAKLILSAASAGTGVVSPY